MSEAVKTTYDGIEIEYDESSNRWRFELNGKERHASSLNLAKQTIDKPEPKVKKKVDPIPAWKASVWSKWEKVTVTSVAETGYRGTEVWVINSKGKRSKERLSDIYADIPQNLESGKKIDNIDKQRAALEEQKREVFGSLVRVDVSAWND